MKTNYLIPKIMGIINATPDSFSDGGKYSSFENAIIQIDLLVEEGADIIDIGGESTRPGAAEVPVKEELRRIEPLVDYVKSKYPEIEVSIDTTKYETAKVCLEKGADIINDISGLEFNPEIAELTAEFDKSLVIMHIKGNPRTMQINPVYDNLIDEIYVSLKNKIEFAQKAGVKNVIADVGIGFGKSFDHNWEMLKRHSEFKSLGVQLLLGISRKRFIGDLFNIEKADERDVQTMLIHSAMSLTESSPDIIRVHNVKLAKQMNDILQKLI